MTLLEGKTAIITGAAQGIGLQIATAFSAEGARVVIADMNLVLAKKAANALQEAGATTRAIRCDVTSESEVEALVSDTVGQFGQLDIMVNNAGITRDATMRTMTLDDFRMVIDVHLQGTWLGTRSAAAAMRRHGAGSIINVSSISGKVGNVGQTNYSAAKAGIVGLTKAAAKEMAHLGVRVNAVQPGLIKTPMTDSMRPDVWNQKLAEIPMGRAGEPLEVARVAVFLASDLSSYMTGAVLEVTGGRYM